MCDPRESELLATIERLQGEHPHAYHHDVMMVARAEHERDSALAEVERLRGEKERAGIRLGQVWFLREQNDGLYAAFMSTQKERDSALAEVERLRGEKEQREAIGGQIEDHLMEEKAAHKVTLQRLSSLTEERDALKRQIDALQAHHPHAYHHDMMMVAKAEVKVSALTEELTQVRAERDELLKAAQATYMVVRDNLDYDFQISEVAPALEELRRITERLKNG